MVKGKEGGQEMKRKTDGGKMERSPKEERQINEINTPKSKPRYTQFVTCPGAGVSIFFRIIARYLSGIFSASDSGRSPLPRLLDDYIVHFGAQNAQPTPNATLMIPESSPSMLEPKKQLPKYLNLSSKATIPQRKH